MLQASDKDSLKGYVKSFQLKCTFVMDHLGKHEKLKQMFRRSKQWQQKKFKDKIIKNKYILCTIIKFSYFYIPQSSI